MPRQVTRSAGAPLRQRAVDRVVRIQELYAAGLHGSKMAQVLPCMRDEDGGPAVRATPARVIELSLERERIDRMTGDLLRWREVLDEVIATGDGRRAAGSPSPQPAA
ncbi:hypothetical protein GCM10010336_51230 [Streptomyces goshikiensis]|nr:hypothetical protein GCM10010336_51230 [Streptomyces goshikiensis]